MKISFIKIFSILLLFLIVPVTSSAEEHWAFRGMNCGPSATFTGKVGIMVAFVDTPNYQWSQSARETAFTKINEAVAELKAQSRRYGANLDLKWRYWGKVSVPYEYSEKNLNWYWWIIKNFFDAQNMRDLQKSLKAELNFDETPVVFLFKKHRDFDFWEMSSTIGITWMSKTSSSWDEEISCVFCASGFTGKTFAHELLHQFGAVDYYNYNHEGVSSAAKKYLGRNLMRADGTYYIDDLTAYIIGWTNNLSGNAKNFLNATRGAR